MGYAHVPSFKKNQRLIDEATLPDSPARAEQAAAMANTLIAAGYRQIGLDHFALPDDELTLAQKAGRLRRNSLGYSADTRHKVIGFGPSAIGRLGDGYVQNEVEAGSYSDQINARRLATAKGYCLSLEDRVRAAIIERLMCDFEVDVPAICMTHGFDPVPFLGSPERLANARRGWDRGGGKGIHPREAGASFSNSRCGRRIRCLSWRAALLRPAKER
ncbi:coproporphyrinogen III oxidase-like Fe-S oxidoreductase [Bradyrhizobium sp. GM22.5]